MLIADSKTMNGVKKTVLSFCFPLLLSTLISLCNATEFIDNLTQDHSKTKRETLIRSPMPGKLVKINVKDGQLVKENDVLYVLEAMKMEMTIRSQFSGKISGINFKAGEIVGMDNPLFSISPLLLQEEEAPLQTPPKSIVLPEATSQQTKSNISKENEIPEKELQPLFQPINKKRIINDEILGDHEEEIALFPQSNGRQLSMVPPKHDGSDSTNFPSEPLQQVNTLPIVWLPPKIPPGGGESFPPNPPLKKLFLNQIANVQFYGSEFSRNLFQDTPPNVSTTVTKRSDTKIYLLDTKEKSMYHRYLREQIFPYIKEFHPLSLTSWGKWFFAFMYLCQLIYLLNVISLKLYSSKPFHKLRTMIYKPLSYYYSPFRTAQNDNRIAFFRIKTG